MDWVNVGGIGVSVAWVLLSLLAAIVGIVQSHNKSLDSLASLLNVDQHSSAAVCQAIEGVDVVDKNHFRTNLQLQNSLEWSVFDATSVVSLESLHQLARILCLDGEELAVDLFQLAAVSRVHLGICAVYVEGIAQDRIILWAHSCLQQGDIFLSVSPNSNPVEEIPIYFVLSLAVIFHQVDDLEQFPQVSQRVGEGMFLVGGLLKDISGLWRLELEEIAENKERKTSKENSKKQR